MAYTGKTPVNFVDVTQSQSMNVTDDLTVDTNTLVVDSANNRVGIGTSSPIKTLHINENDSEAVILIQSSDTGTAGIYMGDQSDSIVGGIVYDNNTDTLQLRSSNNHTAVTIDSAENVLVGTTSNSPVGGNVVGIGLLNNGSGQFSRDGGTVLLVNRKTSDGEVIRITKNGTTVGSIGTTNKGGTNEVYFGTGDTGLYYRAQSDAITPCTTANGSDRDNAIDLGFSSIRFDDIYATNGTIQTSDANEKQQIASLTDAEMTAAKAISKLFKTFKWNDKVEAKGDAARRHAGVIAQDVQQAMTDAGLDAGDYAFFISTTWWETQTEVPAVKADEENGVEAQDAYTRTDTYNTAEEAPEGATERTRLGIRYPELLSFIGAATEQRLASIESRLDALENA